ncbi:MAG TPA: hypothetical protein VFJ81_03495 [Gemmatimonadales bacterium]|nr:hypothetical protein [Gemmatimonadales bacterium]
MRLFLVCVAALQVAASGLASAQSPGPRQDRLVTFESWRPVSPNSARGSPRIRELDELRAHRTRRVLIGGAIGAAAGVVACTAISTLADDSADGGVSFCPLDTYLLVGGAGFLAGAAVAWLF